MIIGFCGRMRSGKTELSKICEKQGYKRLSFALPLKELCAKLLDVSLEELNKLKANNVPIDFRYNANVQNVISTETKIPIEMIAPHCEGRTSNTVRDMLQFIGTDIIRQYNNDWHVNRLRDMIFQSGFLESKEEVNFVFDDVRFQNEKRMIEEMGGDCWFITRPTIDGVSNHPSENSILWGHCYNKVIINDRSLDELLFKWKYFLVDYKESCKLRDKEFDRILNNTYTLKDIATSAMMTMLLIPKWFFTYVPIEYNKDEISSVEMNKDGTVFVKYKDGSREIIENPLSIEDLKLIL